MIWTCGDHVFDLGARALVMAVVNVTPDSFSDGGRFLEPAAALDHARALVREGADLVDLGAESTRPGAAPVPAAEQWRRLAPVIDPLAAEGVCISVDTASAEVAARALASGVSVINDVTALGDPAMAATVAAARAGLVLMHMQGTPATMQADPRYGEVVAEVRDHLAQRFEAAVRAGIATERIALDPGIGFGKTAGHNLELLARLDALAVLGRPLLVGVSRKRFIGTLLGDPTESRLEGSLAAAAVAVFMGARVIRAHDAAATRRALTVATALSAARSGRSTPSLQ